MSERLAAIGENSSLGDDILDELEGEALVILEHPENHAAVTVSMARASLEIILRLRRGNRDREAAPQPA
jgi:hypothetical protein